MSDTVSIGEWLEQGQANGYASHVFCEIHDGAPLSEEEEAEFDDGGDPCVPMIRVYEYPEDQQAVSDNCNVEKLDFIARMSIQQGIREERARIIGLLTGKGAVGVKEIIALIEQGDEE
jgi:hypothetical protein